MKTNCQRLDHDAVCALTELSRADGFPYPLTEDAAKRYCRSRDFAGEGVQTYGVWEDGRLVSVLTATFCRVFPCEDSPSGRIVHISGVFTLPACRGRHYASDLLTMAQQDAVTYGADYLCCDSTADGLYRHNGYGPTSENETRMWKRLKRV